jgi:hypothetical protein
VLFACAVALAGCGTFGEQLQDMQSLIVALQAKYKQPAKVTLNTRGELRIVITQAALDTAKFTRADCSDYAVDVARFAMSHYPKPAALTSVDVSVVVAHDYGLVHETETYCSDGGPAGALGPPAEAPDTLKSAGTKAPTR